MITYAKTDAGKQTSRGSDEPVEIGKEDEGEPMPKRKRVKKKNHKKSRPSDNESGEADKLQVPSVIGKIQYVAENCRYCRYINVQK